MTSGQMQRGGYIHTAQNLFAEYVAVGIQQLVSGDLRHRESQPFAYARQRVEVVHRVLRRYSQMNYVLAVVRGLGADDNVAVARTVRTDMQSRRTVAPATVVFLDLNRTQGAQRDTQCIHDINILAVIHNVHRAGQAAGDGSAEVAAAHVRKILLFYTC